VRNKPKDCPLKFVISVTLNSKYPTKLFGLLLLNSLLHIFQSWNSSRRVLSLVTSLNVLLASVCYRTSKDRSSSQNRVPRIPIWFCRLLSHSEVAGRDGKITIDQNLEQGTRIT
jgi:hypothetical protein